MQNSILDNKEKETKPKPKHTKQQNKLEKASLPEPPEQPSCLGLELVSSHVFCPGSLITFLSPYVFLYLSSCRT